MRRGWCDPKNDKDPRGSCERGVLETCTGRKTVLQRRGFMVVWTEEVEEMQLRVYSAIVSPEGTVRRILLSRWGGVWGRGLGRKRKGNLMDSNRLYTL